MHYDFILFDADETLFSFDIFAGLSAVFKRYDIKFTEHDFAHYQSKNKQLWITYQNGEISAEHLQVTRFAEWAEKLSVEAKVLNDQFLDAMAEICEPLPGAVDLLHKIQGKAKLVIVTNGFQRLQNKRIQRAGLEHVFDWIVISEIVGYPKPHVAIFDHTLQLLGNPPKSKVLMIGDTISSDILGGVNAGIDTCWLQHKGVVNSSDIKPTYQIQHLDELHAVLGI